MAPYVLEMNGSSIINIKKYNGSAWVALPTTGLNLTSISNGYGSSICIDKLDNLYLAERPGATQVYMLAPGGSSWSAVGNLDFGGNAGSDFCTPKILTDQGNNPYVMTFNAGAKQSVYKLNAGTWTEIAPPNVSAYSDMCIFNNTVYYVTPQSTMILAYQYNGSSWSLVGTNISPGQMTSTKYFSIYADAANVYVGFVDTSNAVGVYYYNGSNWTSAGAATGSGTVNQPMTGIYTIIGNNGNIYVSSPLGYIYKYTASWSQHKTFIQTTGGNSGIGMVFNSDRSKIFLYDSNPSSGGKTVMWYSP